MNLTIRARLWAMVIVSIVALFGVGAVGSWTTRAEQDTVVSVMEGTMPSISTLGEIQSAFLSLEVDASGHIATKEPSIKDAAQKGVSESFAKLEAAFAAYEKQAQHLMAQQLALPAYEQVLKAAHTFNLLDARGAISVTERAAYIGRIRNLARAVGKSYLDSRARLGFPMAPKAHADEVLAELAKAAEQQQKKAA